jgi:signal transduction histidine kinase
LPDRFGFFTVFIFDRIKAYFFPPRLADEEQNRIARNMHVISWMVLIGVTAAAVFTSPTGALPTLYTLLFGAVLGLAGIVLTHQRHIQLAAFVVFLGIIGVLTRLLVVSNGIHDIAIMAYPLLIFIASLVLNWRGYILVTTLTLVSIGWVVFGELNGWVLHALVGQTSWIDFAITATILILTATGAHLTSTDMRQSLIRARREIADRNRAEATTRYYATRMETLHEIDRAIISAESIEAIAQAALTRTQLLIPNRRAGVILFDSEANMADVVAYTLNGEIGQTKQRFPLDEFELADELLYGQAHVVNDLSRLEFPSAIEERLLKNGRRSYLDIPLMFHGLLIGAFSLDADEPNAFSPEAIEIAREVADQLAIALQNARLLQQAQQHAESLEVQAAALSQALERQRELDRLQREFIQNVSHELRTPLALIMGHAELLEADERIDAMPEVHSSIVVIARRARLLSRLVDQILRLLEIENRELRRETVDLRELVSAEVRDFEAAASQAGLTLAVDIQSDLPMLTGDPLLLRQLVSNLISNALKFTSDGGRISAQLQCRDDMAVLEVADTGIGIPPQHLGRIFNRFYQVDGSSTRRYGGVGLGLALVKSIVDQHQGRIEVESQVNVGTTFRVWLPTHRNNEQVTINNEQ